MSAPTGVDRDGMGRSTLGHEPDVDYTLDPSRPLQEELRRVAHVQLDEAVARLEDPDDDVVGAVHDCRKRCKKLRGLVRLVRPAMGDRYRPANVVFRDAARQLSDLRDAHALLATFDSLLDADREQVPAGYGDRVRLELHRRAEDATARATPDAAELRAAHTLLTGARSLVDSWSLDRSDVEAIEAGAGKTHGRARRALERAVGAPTAENFHEYRKRTKYGWYHVRLLENCAPSVLGPLEGTFHDLSDTLGDEHDLAVLSSQLRDDVESHGGHGAVEAVLLVVDGRRADLQRRAAALGSRLHAESEEAFSRRLGAYWQAWQDHGPEPAGGGLAAVTSRG